eukprot:1392281-Amorphochlora_amoeboformis.AAC.1
MTSVAPSDKSYPVSYVISVPYSPFSTALGPLTPAHCGALVLRLGLWLGLGSEYIDSDTFVGLGLGSDYSACLSPRTIDSSTEWAIG